MRSPKLITDDLLLLATLRARLGEGPLPGREVQLTMAPPLRGDYAAPPPNARRASVLALLYPIEARLHLLYIQRTSPKRDRHAGQISFPGGSVEPADSDAAATALRETEEEVGIPRDAVELLGGLTPLYIPVSNFLVDPFVGYLPERPAFVLQKSEVARTLELPLADFLSDDVLKVGTRKLGSGMSLPDVPYWLVDNEEIWGATSMITAELVALVR
jgi:8-oxo-dGTP pyrophosphatase MutT (NUDIX family)